MNFRTLSALALAAWLSPPNCPAAEATNSLPQDVYIWQRDWNQPVRQALAEHASSFQEIIALKAEVTWRKGQPQLVQVPLDYTALKDANVPVGLALRIGPYPGPFSSDDKAAVFLTGLASAMVAEAQAGGLKPCGLQMDFDCASSKLDGYRMWVEAIRATTSHRCRAGQSPHCRTGSTNPRSHVSPQPPMVTYCRCIPSKHPKAPTRHSRCAIPRRPAAPWIAPEDLACRFASPCQPTVTSSPSTTEGNFDVGLSPVKDQTRTGRPMCRCAKYARTRSRSRSSCKSGWTTAPPRCEASSGTGCRWRGDSLNLHWPCTLAAMMAGHLPREQVHAAVRRVEPGLVEISLVNDGDLDISSRLAVEVRWQNARLVAGDGLGGFDLADDGPSAVRFQTDNKNSRLPAGEKKIIGWLRLSEDREVRCEIKNG